MSDDTIGKLKDILGRNPVERDVVCPGCNGRIELNDGIYVCPEGSKFKTLAELKAVEKDI